MTAVTIDPWAMNDATYMDFLIEQAPPEAPDYEQDDDCPDWHAHSHYLDHLDDGRAHGERYRWNGREWVERGAA